MLKNILIEPLLTEKSNDQRLDQNKFGFFVDINANKIEIATEIKKRFNIEVISVNTIRHNGKVKSRNTKMGKLTGRTPKYKKAIVTVKKGQTIDIFEQV